MCRETCADSFARIVYGYPAPLDRGRRVTRLGGTTVALSTRSSLQAQIGIAAYLRNIAVRCNRIARACPDAKTHDALSALTAELADKAEILENTFRIPKDGA